MQVNYNKNENNNRTRTFDIEKLIVEIENYTILRNNLKKLTIPTFDCKS